MTLEFLALTIFAGIGATYILLAMAIWNSRLGLPRLDFGKAMSMLTYAETYEGQDPPYWAGTAVVYANGIFFTLLYSTYVAQFLPGTPLIQGAIYGVILWAVSGIFYVPVYLREGFFLSHLHPMAWFASLIAHGAFGLVLGWLAPVM
ncbi:MAG: hypothetical protein HQ503_10800 [Rhodospirillales bacterium]|nr:hypothetical protein [Rhodospirillales bacterium]